MIKNDRQLAQTRHKVDAARAAAAAAETAVDRTSWNEVGNELEAELTEYEAVRSGTRYVFELASIDDLAEALVKARLAKGWTQKQLAQELGVSEQMVQRDEVVGYQRASLARLADVADALGFELQGRLQPAVTDTPPPLEGVRIWSDNNLGRAPGTFTPAVHAVAVFKPLLRAVIAQSSEGLRWGDVMQGLGEPVPDPEQTTG